MARISKGDEELLDSYDLVFEDVPDLDTSRTSRWDGTWRAAVQLCERHPGKTLRVRTYNNASSAYKDAKQVNNGESRYVEQDEGHSWSAIAGPTGEMTEDSKGNEKKEHAIWLTYDPQ